MRLELNGASLSYAARTPFAVTALSAVSLAIEPGERVGVAGPVGSGKSSLLELLAGVTPPSSGEVLHDGLPPAVMSPGRVGLCLQEPERCLFERTVRADVAFGPRQQGLPADEADRRAELALRRAGLAPAAYGHRSPFHLSAGEQRRVALAGVLALEPEALLLDEPAAGLDPAARRELFAWLKALSCEEGVTVVIASHDMDDLAGFAGRLLVLDGGRLEGDGPAPALLADEAFLAEHGLEPPLTVRLSRLLADAAGREVAPALSEAEALAALAAVIEGRG